MSAETKAFITNHRLVHDGKKFAPDSKVQLSETDAAPLLEKKHVRHIVADAKPAPVSEATLAKFTAPELAAYAASFSVAIPADATKQQMIDALKSAGAVALEVVK